LSFDPYWLDIHASLLLFWSSSIWKHDWKESKLTDVEWSPFFSHMFMCCKRHTCFIYINQILEIEKTVVTSTFCKTSVCLMLQTLRYMFEIWKIWSCHG
jgi:hypothetical protein